MHRRAVSLLAVIAFELFGASLSPASVIKSYDKLTTGQAMDLQASENRLIHDDRVLQSLESDLKNRKISKSDFSWQHQEVVAYISAEANFQNQLLTDRPQGIELPEGADKVLRTVGKYTVVVLATVAQSVAGGLANAHYSFSP